MPDICLSFFQESTAHIFKTMRGKNGLVSEEFARAGGHSAGQYTVSSSSGLALVTINRTPTYHQVFGQIEKCFGGEGWGAYWVMLQ